MKQDLTHLPEETQLQRINSYIKQRSFHSDQSVNVNATNLIEKFKHNGYLSGMKRLKFFNALLVKTVTYYTSDNPDVYKKLNITIESVNLPKKKVIIHNSRSNGKKMRLKRKRY